MHTPIIEGPYLKDILDQPAALRRTIPRLGELHDAVVPFVQSHAHSRIVLTGMGGSFHALYPLSIRLNRAGFFAQMIETSELLYYYPSVLQPDTLSVLVSQSGESAEMVRLLRDGFLQGPVIAVTNTPGSTLAAHSKLTILTEAGPESTVSCKTYLATLAALHALAAAMTAESVGERLIQAADAVATYLNAWQSHVDWFADRLQSIARVFVGGRGCSLATAGTGGLILKESTRIAAEGMSAAALRHGPFESLSDQIVCVICEGDSAAASLNRRLHNDIIAVGGRSFLLAVDAPDAALRLPAVHPELLPLVEILPIQMMTLALAGLRGEEAGRFRLATKVTTVE